MNSNRFTEAGMAAFMPGLVYAVEILQAQLDELRSQIAAAQGHTIHRKKGTRKVHSYWAAMTPEERSAEMARRVAKRRTTQGKDAVTATAKINAELLNQLHPRDPRSPKHAAWLKAMKAGVRKRWAAMRPAERKAIVNRLNAGRKKAAA